MRNFTRKLQNAVDDFIRENKKSYSEGYRVDLEDIPEEELEHVCGIIIEDSLAQHRDAEWFHDTASQEVILTFAAALQRTGDKKNLKDMFYDTFKKESIKANKGELEYLIELRIDEVYKEDMEELRLMSKYGTL